MTPVKAIAVVFVVLVAVLWWQIRCIQRNIRFRNRLQQGDRVKLKIDGVTGYGWVVKRFKNSIMIRTDETKLIRTKAYNLFKP